MNSNWIKKWTYINSVTSLGMEIEENIPTYLSCLYMVSPTMTHYLSDLLWLFLWSKIPEQHWF